MLVKINLQAGKQDSQIHTCIHIHTYHKKVAAAFWRLTALTLSESLVRVG